MSVVNTPSHPDRPSKVCLVSLGCPKNLVDSEIMLGFLRQAGFELTNLADQAQIIIVNTCGFIESAKQESIDYLLELARYKEEGSCQLLVATGCLSQRYAKELASDMPEVDLFVGLETFNELPVLISEALSQLEKSLHHKRVQAHFSVTQHEQPKDLRPILPDPDLPRVRATPRHYSYLKISEGCSHRCSFCVIPYIRGDLVSRQIDSIEKEVRIGLDQGVREFNLIAQDLNEYGKDLRNGSDLASLLIKLNAIPGDFWLRPLYMYPLEFSDRLIGVLKDSEHIVKYIDMPLQHINDRVMQSMKRGSPSRYVRQLLTKLKTQIPDITIRTTFIVGYPGETKEEFEELCSFVKEFEFDHVGVFTYSQEEQTEAAKLPDQIAEEMKQQRHDRLMQIQKKISKKKNQDLMGKTFKLLCEGVSEESDLVLQSRLARQAPEVDGVTYLSETIARPGEFLLAKIIQVEDYDLVAAAL